MLAEDYLRFGISKTAALAKLSHPGIATLYQPGTAAEIAALPGDRVRRRHAPLRRWLAEHQPDLRARVQCLIEICRAIARRAS